MVDVFSPEERSAIMRKVKGKDTKPELVIRSLLHRLGYRFRLHRKDLPGKPDIVLPKFKKVIFVHGCFWHGHKGCKNANRPKSNVSYWNKKIDRNMQRDKTNQSKLKDMGWDSLTIWECEIRDADKLANKICEFLS